MKNFFWSKFAPKGPKSGMKLGFLPFSQVWFISFSLPNDSLQQFLTSIRGEIHEKTIFRDQIKEQNRPKSEPKLGFLPFSQV